jgi:L-lactate dehydrogenase complex protein LldF
VLVTNEGNGRLVTALPRVHIAVLGMERLAADWAQADLLLALLARSATGQRLSSYTNVVTGVRGQGEVDGPDELHVVILDNGRSDMLAGEYHEMLGCIRCGACLNVCPVYRQTGGHAYGWVYPGPMGAVLTPLLAADQPEAAEVAGASTLCGACMDACPVQIPLQDLLLSLRRRKAEHAGRTEQVAWKAWSTAWSDPRRYRATTKAATWTRWAAGLAGRLPVGRDWAQGRTLPRPAGERFRDRWKAGL